MEPGAAGLQAILGQELPERLNVVKGDVLDLDGQPGGHSHLAVAKALSSFGDGAHLVSGDLAVAGDDPGVEAVGSILVPQEAKSLDASHILGRNGSAGSLYPHFVESSGAFQHQSVFIAVETETILQEVSPLAAAADQQQFLVLANSLQGAVAPWPGPQTQHREWWAGDSRR